ncbi:MAG: sigma-70 family RNA polymerase sigma factor [Kofleriaceae bacterium]
METAERELVELPVRTAALAGELDAATTAALRLYGRELYAFMTGIARDRTVADDAFSALCELVWKRLAEFRWEASLRSWLYVLARRLVLRVRVDGYRRDKRTKPLDVAQEIRELAAQIRTETLEILRTDVKDAFRALRDELSTEDQELLALRVDRDMSWRDIASIVDAEDADPRTLDQRAAALRKRFERVKDRLRELALARGLLEG